jgi:DNA-directed RNA polymerase specialized sigma24 family protein
MSAWITLWKKIGMEAYPFTDEQKKRLQRALDGMPTENRQVLSLYFECGYTRQTIAARLQWSLSKVNNKLTRGVTLVKWRVNSRAFDQAKEIAREINRGYDGGL